MLGAGPNGLAAALTIARAGRSVLVVEGAASPGGGSRTAELIEPGFVHDLCSAFHPLGVASPFFRDAGLDEHGLKWVHPEIPLAHPLDGGAALLRRDVADTATGLAEPGWQRHIGRVVGQWSSVDEALLGPLIRVPRHPLSLARFGVPAAMPASWLARRWFRGAPAQALFAGAAAHSFLPLTAPLTASLGMTLTALAHGVGWPVAAGGSGAIVDALVAALHAAGGRLETGRPVRSVAELPPAAATLLDVSAGQLHSLLGDRLQGRWRRAVGRFRPGAAAYKIDYTLDGPVPWSAGGVGAAGTVHLGGTLEEIAWAEAEVNRGRMPTRPFVLVGQQSVADPSRAPVGKHTLWVYGHVPNGYDGDATSAIEAQILRFAPLFRDVVRARRVTTPHDLEAANPNFAGGDISSGSLGHLQLVRRPVLSPHPHRLPVGGYYLCSASTPPGPGVHGMAGHHAALDALTRELA